MTQQNEKQPKAKTGLARCLELASDHKGLVFLSGVLAALAAIVFQRSTFFAPFFASSFTTHRFMETGTTA